MTCTKILLALGMVSSSSQTFVLVEDVKCKAEKAEQLQFAEWAKWQPRVNSISHSTKYLFRHLLIIHVVAIFSHSPSSLLPPSPSV